MKKTLLVIVLVCAALGAVSAQEGAGGAAASTMADAGLLNAGNLENYSKPFLNGNGSSISSKYIRVASDGDFNKIAPLGGNEERIDTPLEIALLSTCAGVVDVRPVEASNMLGNARQADLKLGAAVLKELTEIKFLDPNNRGAVGRYEGILTFITDRGNATRVEIESYYRQGIGSLVAEVVREELNEKRDGYIPAEVYANWKRIGAGDAQALMTDAITRFYLDPSQTTFRKLVEIYARQYHLSVEKDLFARTGRDTFNAILLALSASLEEKVGLTGLGLNVEVATLDPRYSVFSTPYGIDGGGY